MGKLSTYKEHNPKKKLLYFNKPIAEYVRRFIGRSRGKFDLVVLDHTTANTSRALREVTDEHITAFSKDAKICKIDDNMTTMKATASVMYNQLRSRSHRIIIHDGQQYASNTLPDIKIVIDQDYKSLGIAVNLVPRDRDNQRNKRNKKNGGGKLLAHNTFLDDVKRYAESRGYTISCTELASYSQSERGGTMWPFWFELTRTRCYIDCTF